MERIQRLLASAASTLAFFGIVLLFLKPLLNSGDDAFVLYAFSGGFGVTPTELVDYNHVWHFVLGVPIKNLFIYFPSVNWYTLLLLMFHFTAVTLIFYVFLKRFKLAVAICCYLIFIIFFEARYLLSLTFTNTAIIGALAGNLLLIDSSFHVQLNKPRLLIAFSLLLISGLIRFHAWGFAEFFLAPLVLFLKGKSRIKYLVLKSFLFIALVLSFFFHVEYYKKNIANWQEQEDVRQRLFTLSNRPSSGESNTIIFKSPIERELFNKGFFYDSSIVEKINGKNISQLIRTRGLSIQEDVDILYWLFVEARVYLFLFTVLYIFLLLQKQLSIIKRHSLFILTSTLLFCYLFMYQKITEYMSITFFCANFITLVSLASFYKIDITKKARYFFLPLLACSFFWMFIRIKAINEKNCLNYESWLSAYSDLKKNSHKIHVATDYNFPIDYFSVTDVPEDLKIPNFLAVGQFSKTLYKIKRQQFGLEDPMLDFVKKSNVVLLGNKITLLEQYYYNKYGLRVTQVSLQNYSRKNAYALILK